MTSEWAVQMALDNTPEVNREQFRRAVEAGLCEPIYIEVLGGWMFRLTHAGADIVEAGGSVAGLTMVGRRLH
jgi:hypothetical protein